MLIVLKKRQFQYQRLLTFHTMNIIYMSLISAKWIAIPAAFKSIKGNSSTSVSAQQVNEHCHHSNSTMWSVLFIGIRKTFYPEPGNHFLHTCPGFLCYSGTPDADGYQQQQATDQFSPQHWWPHYLNLDTPPSPSPQLLHDQNQS